MRTLTGLLTKIEAVEARVVEIVAPKAPRVVFYRPGAPEELYVDNACSKRVTAEQLVRMRDRRLVVHLPCNGRGNT
jgi:hypothetical protein